MDLGFRARVRVMEGEDELRKVRVKCEEGEGKGGRENESKGGGKLGHGWEQREGKYLNLDVVDKGG